MQCQSDLVIGYLLAGCSGCALAEKGLTEAANSAQGPHSVIRNVEVCQGEEAGHVYSKVSSETKRLERLQPRRQ